MPNQKTKRRCKGCKKIFLTDPRNAWHQEYCKKPVCRKASKAASQKKWLMKEENQFHFCGPVNVQRVQAWRKAHPGYWKKKTAESQSSDLAQAPELAAISEASHPAASTEIILPNSGFDPPDNTALPLQDLLVPKDLNNHDFAIDQITETSAAKSPLQDLLNAQPMILIGLIAHLTGSALQDNIALTSRRLQQLGNDILNNSKGGKHDSKTPHFGADTQGSRAVQLGGPASGP